MQEKKYKDFVIHDCRISFEAGGDSPEQRTEAATKETPGSEPAQENTADKKKSHSLLELAFSGFILSLATTAQRGPGIYTESADEPDGSKPSDSKRDDRYSRDTEGENQGKSYHRGAGAV